MADIATTMMLLSDVVVKGVFKTILENRTALFREVIASLGKRPDDPDARKEVEAAVARLMKADLIKERTAPIEDFKSYSVTSDGLGAERQLRLAERQNTTPSW